jgi:AcrR family transcriptional regulator
VAAAGNRRAARAEPELAVIWMRPQRPARGPRPTHSRDEITTAAIRIADAEGIEAVSMRRVAAELGTGATSLYRYVSRKEDLFDLMVDAVLGEDGPAGRPSGDWRADLLGIAHRTRATILRHPWMAALASDRTTLGPNALDAAEHALSVVDGLGLDIDEMLVVLGTLQAFVRGYVVSELAEQEAMRRSGLDRDRWMQAHSPYIRTILESGRHPRVARVVIDATAPHDADRAERGFALGLERLLEGFAAALPHAGRAPAGMGPGD